LKNRTAPQSSGLWSTLRSSSRPGARCGCQRR
jgi:hypothetical protein